MEKIVIPGELPGMNKIVEASKQHWGRYSKMKKKNTELVAWCCKGKGPYKKIDLDITFYCKNRMRDPDNIMGGGHKFILDGLVEAGVIKNDGWKEVNSISSRCKVDRVNQRVEVLIKESEDD